MLPVIAKMMNWRSRLTGIATGDQAIFVTRTAFEAVNGYPNISLMEDISLCNRLKKRTPPLCLSAKVHSSARRWQQFGVFKTIFLMWSLRWGYFFGAAPTPWHNFIKKAVVGTLAGLEKSSQDRCWCKMLAIGAIKSLYPR